MKIESQVCTPEQAKKLKGLGITAKSWLQWMAPDAYTSHPYVLQGGNGSAGTRYPAFSVAELGQMLPDGRDVVTTERITQFQTYRSTPQTGGLWSCMAYYSFQDQYGDQSVWQDHEAETEAQARAAMLIYLLENNHVTAADVNARLAQ